MGSIIAKVKKILKDILPVVVLDNLGFWFTRKEQFLQGTWPRRRAMATLRKSVQNPKTFAEKVRYKMAFDRNPILQVWADKVAVREYVSETIGAEYLTNIFGTFRNPEDIWLAALPTNFVIKPNHASGAVIIVWEGAVRQDSSYLESFMKTKWGRILINPLDMNQKVINRILRKWLSQNYYYEPGFFPEWAYKGIKPQLIVEEFLPNGANGVAQDFRFFLFNGVCEYIRLDINWNDQPTETIFDTNWSQIDVTFDKFPPAKPLPDKPSELELMISLAEKCGQGTDFARCDFYLVNSRIIFGELTNYPSGGGRELIVNGSLYTFGESWKPDKMY